MPGWEIIGDCDGETVGPIGLPILCCRDQGHNGPHIAWVVTKLRGEHRHDIDAEIVEMVPVMGWANFGEAISVETWIEGLREMGIKATETGRTRPRDLGSDSVPD